MEIITTLDKFRLDNCETGIALGSFDGVHIGHQTLIVNLIELCKAKGLKSVIYTFMNHPRNLTSANGMPKKVITNEKKITILRELGIDYLVLVEFDEYQRTLPPENFIKNVLKDTLKMSHAVVGFDYRFGYKAQGDVDLLRNLTAKYEYGLSVLEPIKIQNDVISSTIIRQMIAEGQIAKANLYLGRQYSILGQVIKGKGLGHKFGFPTANISLEPQLILPNPGVYFTKCIVNNTIYNSITNVGYNPTVGINPISVEAHILDFDKDIYDYNMEIIFYHKLRNEIKFEKLEHLIAQMHTDIRAARNFFVI